MMTMQNMLILAVAAAVAAGYSFPRLNHFKSSEFGLWFPFIDTSLLLMLDELRARWGREILVSPAEGGIGRLDDSGSQHNLFETMGKVRALDIFPLGTGPDGKLTSQDKRELLALAKDIGFTGVGFYTDTEPRDMMHIDNRDGGLKTWGRVAGQYVGIEAAIA